MHHPSGAGIREKAKNIQDLLNDPEYLQNERREAQKIASKLNIDPSAARRESSSQRDGGGGGLQGSGQQLWRLGRAAARQDGR